MFKVNKDYPPSEKILELRHFSNFDALDETAHRLRTHLMAIGSLAQGIESGVSASPAESGRLIREECEKLLHELNALLSFSRMENEAFVPVLSEVFLYDLIQNCLGLFASSAAEKGICLALDTEDKDLCVLANEDLLENVLENILANAVRYARSEIKISYHASGDMVRLSVSDDGEGINAQDLPHLFDRYYKGKDGNFGLGLAIAKTAAEKIGGKITASNLDGGGAAFTVYLKRTFP